MNNKKKLPDYSVLMSVYKNEKPAFLKTAMNSMWKQSVPTNDFVLMCDGPLTPELDAVIREMEQKHTELHVIRLEKNGGLGNALNMGMRYCKNELIARMDSDDISRLDRCEKQLRCFQNHPEISIVSGTVEEFTVSTEFIDARRIPPKTQKEILSFAKKRNPFNHPCVMYKKSSVEASGGYQDFYLLEDYYLWIRMMQQGAVGYNLQEPLLWMRAGSDMYKRRAGWKYVKSQMALFGYMKEAGLIGEGRYVMSVSIRLLSGLAPNWLRKLMYKIVLRQNAADRI